MNNFAPEVAPRARSAIVTGAAGGIGITIAEELAENGYAVGISDLDDTRLGEAADRIRRSTGSERVHACAANVSDAS